jgi:hypothetical protein
MPVKTSNDIFLNYQPSDFYFYNSSDFLSGIYTPSSGPSPSPQFPNFVQETCDSLQPYNEDSWSTKCNKNGTTDYFLSCYQKELCKNRDYANKLMNYSNFYSGSDEKLINVNDIFNHEVSKTVNLGIGVVGVFVFILYNYNK